MPNYIQVQFTDFPLVLKKLLVFQENCLWFRGHHKNDTKISSIPTFFSSINVAKDYVRDKNYKLDMYVSKRPIKLIDLRYLIIIIREMFNYPNMKLDTTLINYIGISLGLCSFEMQTKLIMDVIQTYGDLNDVYRIKQTHRTVLDIYNKDKVSFGVFNPIEPMGVRYGITHIDRHVMLFLKSLLHNSGIDGFIAPRLFSPYKPLNYASEEILLFNPAGVGMTIINGIENQLYSINTVSIVDYCNLAYEKQYSNFSRISISEPIIQLGGGRFLNDNDKTKFDNMYKNLSQYELDYCKYCYKVGRMLSINIDNFLPKASDGYLPNPSIHRVSSYSLNMSKIDLTNQNKFDNMYDNMTPDEQAFCDRIEEMFNPKNRENS